MACLAAECSVTHWCTFLLWCKALWCSRGWPTKNCIQEQIALDILFTHMELLGWDSLVTEAGAFPMTEDWPATGSCWPHHLHQLHQAHWYHWQSAGIQRVLPAWHILFLCLHPDYNIYTWPTSRATHSWWCCRPAVSKGKWGHLLQSLDVFTKMPGSEMEQPKVCMY